jgi:hypothetical protein
LAAWHALHLVSGRGGSSTGEGNGGVSQPFSASSSGGCVACSDASFAGSDSRACVACSRGGGRDSSVPYSTSCVSLSHSGKGRVSHSCVSRSHSGISGTSVLARLANLASAICCGGEKMMLLPLVRGLLYFLRKGENYLSFAWRRRNVPHAQIELCSLSAAASARCFPRRDR